MKNLKVIVLLTMVSGLFLTSCEKEYESNPLPTPGNTQNILKDGEISGSTNNSTGTGSGDSGITDGGRDEDYDKSGKLKRRPNNN